jgi:hypothetical protein
MHGWTTVQRKQYGHVSNNTLPKTTTDATRI